MTKNQRRTFNAEFKLQVVQMNREQGLSVGDVCRGMKLGATTPVLIAASAAAVASLIGANVIFERSGAFPATEIPPLA
jgi:transposase-like protein